MVLKTLHKDSIQINILLTFRKVKFNSFSLFHYLEYYNKAKLDLRIKQPFKIYRIILNLCREITKLIQNKNGVLWSQTRMGIEMLFGHSVIGNL